MEAKHNGWLDEYGVKVLLVLCHVFAHMYIIFASVQIQCDMADYQDDNIITLNWDEHIRMRPGMYIGKLGNGSSF